MSITAKSSTPQHATRRVWKVPTSKARWLWLACSALLYAGILAWYLYAVKTQSFPGPLSDPLRLFGIVAFVLVLCTAAYSLRRRFARALPGKAQDWLWMHTWVGITAILVAVLHENFAYLTHAFCQNLSCVTNAYGGMSALFALILLVASGILGRLLDVWQTHSIAHDASTNGVGIIRALEEHILELEYTIERLCAGKSEPFKQYCMQALDGTPTAVPSLAPNEHSDFQRAYETVTAHTRLLQSVKRQRRALLLIRTWRSVHIALACFALCIIAFHGVMELLTNVLHLIRLT